MNASAQAVGKYNRTGVPAEHGAKSSKLTRPVYAVAPGNQGVNELSETLKRIMASATALLGVRNCWITGLDLASQKLITIAALSQDTAEESHLRLAMQQRIASWVTTNRVPALINDILHDPRCQTSGPFLGGSMLCVPLLSGQQILGTITVSNPFPGSFNQQALMILQLLADQTILAISKARQIEAAHQQAHELAIVLDMAKAMTSTLETRQIMSALVTGIRRLVPCDEAVIFGFAEQAQELRAVARLGARGFDLEDLRISLRDKQSVAAWVAQNRRPIIQAPGGRMFVGRITGVLLGEDDLALLGVPLLSKEQLRGVVLLGRFPPFNTNELHTMLNMSNMIAIALEQISI
ncbi:MAG TPA: GAF domain-containing protein [Ktedonobacterales bacterium]|nr:GAF domain-containing protein [Ktedonobacterales bacterium]